MSPSASQASLPAFCSQSLELTPPPGMYSPQPSQQMLYRLRTENTCGCLLQQKKYILNPWQKYRKLNFQHDLHASP